MLKVRLENNGLICWMYLKLIRIKCYVDFILEKESKNWLDTDKLILIVMQNSKGLGFLNGIILDYFFSLG